MTTAIITAHGQQERMERKIDYPKQLLKVGDMTIAERTVRLCFEHGIPAERIFVIAPAIPAWTEFTTALGINPPHALKHHGRPLLDGLFEAQSLFSETDKTVILLGDVVFSRAAFRTVMEDVSFSFYGRPGPNLVTGKTNGEMFAWSFPAAMRPQALDLLRRALMQAQGRALYWLYKFVERFTFKDCFTKIDDYTDDVDDPRDLSMLPVLAKAIAQEEACPRTL